MININIIVPANSEDYDLVHAYYRDTLQFREAGGQFFLPTNNDSVTLRIMTPSFEQGFLPSDRKLLPCFAIHLDKSFLSYCLAAYKRGALFDMACRHPGGFYARIFDPAGNAFEIWCASDADDIDIDVSEMPFYYSY